jgi:predicted TIM-barrel enzyme
MKLSHSPVVEEFSTAHCVAEVNFPSIVLIDVTHRSSSSTFCHNGVGLTEERFTDDCNAKTCLAGLNSGAQTSATSSDDDYIEPIAIV